MVKINFSRIFQGTLVPGNPEEMKRARGLIMRYASAITAESRFSFGWKNVVILRPNHELLDTKRNLEWWRYAWSPAWPELNNAFMETCRINIYTDRAIRAMIGPRDFRVHGVGSDDSEVPLTVSGPFSRSATRKDPNFRNIPLF